MWTILESKNIQKQSKKIPKEILKEYEAWKKVIQLTGPLALISIPGYRDHALKGEWQGARSSWLSFKWCVIYVINAQYIEIRVLEITTHDYRKKT